MSFNDVWFRRLKYMLSPQLDLYQNIARKIPSSSSVLDYGCGNGIGTLQFSHAGRRVIGIDSDPIAIQFCRAVVGQQIEFAHADYSMWQGSVPLLHSEPLAVNVVVCIEVIEHVNSWRTLLGSLRKCLFDDNGMAFFSTLNHNSQYRKNDDHVGRWKVADFRKVLDEFFPGIRIVDYTLENELEDDSSITPMVGVWGI